MKILKFILKSILRIVLAPLWLLLTLLIGIFNFVLHIGSWILCIFAVIIAIVGVFVLFTETVKDGILTLLLAYAISPWGLPMLGVWLLSKLILFKEWIVEKVY